MKRSENGKSEESGVKRGTRRGQNSVAATGGSASMHDDDIQIYGKPGHLIRRLQQIAVAIFMAETKPFHITPVQYAALLAIKLHRGIDQTALVNIIAFDRSTIGDVLNRLQEKKLIKRMPGVLDRRSKVLDITPAGRKLLDEIEKAVISAQESILAPLSAREKVQFMRLMSKLVNINNSHSRAPVRPKNARGRQ